MQGGSGNTLDRLDLAGGDVLTPPRGHGLRCPVEVVEPLVLHARIGSGLAHPPSAGRRCDRPVPLEAAAAEQGPQGASASQCEVLVKHHNRAGLVDVQQRESVEGLEFVGVLYRYWDKKQKDEADKKKLAEEAKKKDEYDRKQKADDAKKSDEEKRKLAAEADKKKAERSEEGRGGKESCVQWS